jgi:hypothetical protein
MKKLLSIALLSISWAASAQRDIQTTRITHLLIEPNQATFNHLMVLPPGTTALLLEFYYNGYYKIRYNHEEYFIYYPYFTEIEYARDLRDQILTGGVNIKGTQKATPFKKVSSTPSRVIHTGPRGGRYYINKNGNKTYIKH